MTTQSRTRCAPHLLFSLLSCQVINQVVKDLVSTVAREQLVSGATTEGSTRRRAAQHYLHHLGQEQNKSQSELHKANKVYCFTSPHQNLNPHPFAPFVGKFPQSVEFGCDTPRTPEKRPLEKSDWVPAPHWNRSMKRWSVGRV